MSHIKLTKYGDIDARLHISYNVQTIKDIGLDLILIIKFCLKIYSICKNNAISTFFLFPKLSFEQINRPFNSVVLCTANTTPAVITHSYMLQKPPFGNDNN